MIVGKPHPSHPFKESYLTVYETARAAQKKHLMNGILANEKIGSCKM